MIKDLTNQKFGKLIAKKPCGKTASCNTIWECVCECGRKHNVINTDLTRGRVKSCGNCSGVKKNIKIKSEEQKISQKFKTVHSHMMDRVYGKREFDAQYYNNRIFICDKWLNFNGFKEDMWDSYIEHIKEYGMKQTTIDRINNNGNYCKENCRWATLSEQVENRRNQKIFKAISPEGEVFVSKNQRKFAREHNVPFGCLNSVINGRSNNCKGWIIEVLYDGKT
jgi:hypothetical protein